MRKMISSIAAVVFIIVGSIFPINTALAQTGGYVGVFGGYTFGSDATWNFGDFNFRFDLDPNNTWAFGVKLGYTPPSIPFLSFELEYSHFKPDLNRTVILQAGTDFATLEGKARYDNLLYNMYVKYPEGRFHPYFGAGIGLSSIDVSAQSTGRLGGINFVETTRQDENGFAWQILAGVDIDLTHTLVVDIGYRYFATEAKFDVTKLDYKTNMVTVGLKYKF